MASMASTTKTHFKNCLTSSALRSYLAEFISTFFYVFSAVGSIISSRKLTPDAESDPTTLVATAAAQAFAYSVSVYMAAEASGGHVNPAVTFGLAVGGHVTIPTAIFYWAVQLVGATLACLLLRVATTGQAIPTTAIAPEMTGFGGAVLEGVVTFVLVYTVYAAGDARKLTSYDLLDETGLVVVALAHGFALFVTVYMAVNISGGHVNPAVTFAMVIGGHVSVPTGIFYWLAQLLGSTMSCLVWMLMTSGHVLLNHFIQFYTM
ncbi:putative aquaporin TIP5-1 [Acorus calamus]|uniref:Aquaporin TIP5-1 n=1 Tax=Acorus calamus TaxID=4465 RepID=A0AAV9CBL7_ACOCL|nr:putative aquaporin TIP5-1 [Acorus calamus]